MLLSKRDTLCMLELLKNPPKPTPALLEAARRRAVRAAAAIVDSPEEWERKTKRSSNLAEFFADSPLRGVSVKIERRRDRPRKTDP